MVSVLKLLKQDDSIEVKEKEDHIIVDSIDRERIYIDYDIPKNDSEAFDLFPHFTKPIIYNCSVSINNSRAAEFLSTRALINGSLTIRNETKTKLESVSVRNKLKIIGREDSHNLIEFENLSSKSVIAEKTKLSIKNVDGKREIEEIRFEDGERLELFGLNLEKLVVDCLTTKVRLDIENSKIEKLWISSDREISSLGMINTKVEKFDSSGFQEVKQINTRKKPYFPQGLKDTKSKRELCRLYFTSFNSQGYTEKAKKFKYKFCKNRDFHKLYQGSLKEKREALINLVFKGSWGYGYQMIHILGLGVLIGLFFSGVFLEVSSPGGILSANCKLIREAIIFTSQSLYPMGSLYYKSDNILLSVLSAFGKLIGLFILTMTFAYAKSDTRI